MNVADYALLFGTIGGGFEQYWCTHTATSDLGISTIIPLTSSVAWHIAGVKNEFPKTGWTTQKVSREWAVREIIGYEDIKRLFRMALESGSKTHILLVGPPASAKTMFLTSLSQFLKNAYFIDGGNSTKARIFTDRRDRQSGAQTSPAS